MAYAALYSTPPVPSSETKAPSQTGHAASPRRAPKCRHLISKPSPIELKNLFIIWRSLLSKSAWIHGSHRLTQKTRFVRSHTHTHIYIYIFFFKIYIYIQIVVHLVHVATQSAHNPPAAHVSRVCHTNSAAQQSTPQSQNRSKQRYDDPSVWRSEAHKKCRPSATTRITSSPVKSSV